MNNATHHPYFHTVEKTIVESQNYIYLQLFSIQKQCRSVRMIKPEVHMKIVQN